MAAKGKKPTKKPAKSSAKVKKGNKYTASWKSIRPIAKDLLLLSQGSRDFFKDLSTVSLISEVVIHSIKYNTNAKRREEFPIVLQFRSAYSDGERIPNYKSRSIEPRELKKSDFVSRAFFSVRKHTEHVEDTYPFSKKGGKTYYILIVGMTSVQISFDFISKTDSAKLFRMYLLDLLHSAVTTSIVNRTHMEQAAIVGLVRGVANDYLDQKKFIYILSGNADLFYSTFGFSKIYYLVSPDLRILMEGRHGYAFDYSRPTRGDNIGRYIIDSRKVNEKDFSETLRLPLYRDSEVKVLLHSPNYSRVYVRDILAMGNFMTTLKTIFENSFNIMMDRINAKQIQDTLRRNSERDYLTKLLNRNGFYRVLKEQVRWDSNVLLVEIDIDNFKIVNDTYGHEAGDQVLQLIARQMNDAFTRNSVLSRFGGEEFYILVPNQSFEDGLRMLDNFRNRISMSPLVYKHEGSHIDINFTVSCGASIINLPKKVDKIKDFLKPHMINIDKALYAAKNNGKNCIYYFDDGECRRFLHQFPTVRSG